MNLKRFFSTAFSLIIIGGVFLPGEVWASREQYFDFGPYYNQPQVLGFSFSSLENLPAPKIPDNIMPQKAGGFMPDNFFYPLEKLTENVQLAVTFNPVKKEELRLGFATERLSEAKTLMEQGKIEAASSALREYSNLYQETAQALSSLTTKGDPGTQELAGKVEKVASAQVVVTQNLSLTTTSAQAEEWNLATKVAQKVLDEVAEAKGEPAVPEDLSIGIQKLKEQGLISEEESNKIYGLESRSKLREELSKLASSGRFPASELMKLDTAVSRNFPDVSKAMAANMQVAELRVYQTLPQPSEEILAEMKKWQDNPGIPPPNDIKPYLWHNRAEGLAREVDLSNFPAEQQSGVARLYPQAITTNPTYISPLSPTPSLSPTPAASDSQTTDQTPDETTGPGQAPNQNGSGQADLYLGEVTGALPGEPTYFIKQWGENVRFAFTFDPAEKARLKMQQAERRLSEAEAVSSDSKKTALYENTLRDYQKAMTDASLLLKGAKDEEKAQEAAEKLESQAARHEAVLEKGLLPVPKDAKLLSEAIKATEDALDGSADVQGRPALPGALADRLGNLKAQGLILPEEAEDLVRSASREEVREKVRKLVEAGSFPPADAKKLDEAQALTFTSDYNQLVEVRKIEELQKLRSVQAEFAQTPTLKSTAATLGQREAALLVSIDPSLIKKEDLGGRKDLIETFERLVSTPRPINGGQFVSASNPSDYEQYKCEGPRQYYSFAAKKCIAYDDTLGFRDDAQPICPVGYTWSWQTQSCQTFTGGGSPLPTPRPEVEPKDDEEREARSKLCPEGSSYQAPNGCVWDKDGKPVYDSSQYRCGRGQYYSFEEFKCVTSPKEGEPYLRDAVPACKEDNNVWSWSEGRCILVPPEAAQKEVKEVSIPKPFLAAPGSPFYPIKQFGETVRLGLAFTPEAKQEVRVAQARERLVESYTALEKGDQESFTKAISNYTAKMQEIFNDVSQSSLSDKAKKVIGEKLAKEAVEQNLILQKIEVVAKTDEAAVLGAASSVVILGVDKAADLSGKPAIPEEVKAKVEALPEQMISLEDKKKLLETSSRVDARLKVGDLVAKGGLTNSDAAFLNEDFGSVGKGAQWKIEELQKLKEFARVQDQKKEVDGKIEKNEDIVTKLTEFQKSFEVGKEIPADIRPYVRLTRIEEVAQTIRPDIVKLEGFQNRKDIILAVATLQEEFRPTKESMRKVEEFRRRNPSGFLPPELARIEALSFGLGIREQAGPCFLPTPPFPANTPCPAPGAPIPVVSYTTSYSSYWGSAGDAIETKSYSWQTSVDKDGKPLVYGQGPVAASTGVCPSDYHWMYDSGGWCMSNSGNYSSNTSSYTPSGPVTPGYTPYSPYYTAPGASPATSGYPVGDNSLNDGCPYGYDSDGQSNCIRNSYPSPSYSYSPPSYYGSAPTYYTTNPPPGTVPGSGPKPSTSGQCPSGYHWMSDSGGWCMADGPTYVPGGSSVYPSGTTTSSTPPPSGTYSSPSSYQYGCTPGYYWDGSKCVAGSYEGSGWSDSAARSGTYCKPPSSGCGSNSYWDYGSCSCRGSTSYYGGSGPSTSNSCQGISCGGGSYLDYSTCSCKYSSSGGSTPYTPSSYTSPSSSCSPPSGGCGSGWFDSSSCSCKTASSQGCYNVSASSCGSGWYFDSAACTCRQSTSSTTPTSGSTSGGGGSSSGSCPSGYHWMSDSGGWCMADGAGSSSGGSTSTSTTTSSPPPSDSTTSQQPSTSTAPSSSEPAPAPSTSTTESSPPPSEPAPQ